MMNACVSMPGWETVISFVSMFSFPSPVVILIFTVLESDPGFAVGMNLSPFSVLSIVSQPLSLPEMDYSQSKFALTSTSLASLENGVIGTVEADGSMRAALS